MNIFIIFIPFLYYLLIEKKESIKKLIKSKYYISGLLVGIGTFLFHTKALYGVYTLNPKFVYRNNDVNINYHGNQYPIILFGNLENNEVLVSTDELNACQTVEDLIEIIINKLKEN